ncbi:MAG: PSP1 domain-containing protein [Saprospiraceae bacterium]
MGCLGCSTCSSSGSSAKGCQSNGGCGSGGCNRLNTFDWLSHLEISDIDPYDVVEVSFKNGAHKAFFQVAETARVATGDMVVVETGNGYDIGKVTLSGELVRLQMKKKKAKPQAANNQVIRKANERDLERLQEAREMETPTMVRARAIARSLGLDMKIGDVEFQGDRRKATFYYTADGRVDFRELIRHYAKEFKIKIEMRQIGARQESARIGGIGSCGRELCCSTWLSDFKSVSTAAARYQNLAINQAKLSGQCGRLKCCLNYELDTYLDALESFPEKSDFLFTQKGKAILVKTDIFKRIMFYVYEHERGRGQFYPLEVEKVREIIEMNARGEKPEEFEISAAVSAYIGEPAEVGFADVTGEIELPEEKRRRKKKKKSRGREADNPQAKDSSTHRPAPPGAPKPQMREQGDRNSPPSQPPAKNQTTPNQDPPAAGDKKQHERRNWKKNKNKRR